MIELIHGQDVLLLDPRGAGISGCRIDDVWVMPDIRGVEPTFAAGEQLFPWPNRLRDGRWRDGETERHCALTEPARNNAIHGLLRDVVFTGSIVGNRACLEGRLAATESYPWDIDCAFTFTLTPHALTVESEFTNLGGRPAPWAFGAHPYIALPGTPESVQFALAATRYLETDEQMIPLSEHDVVGTPFDFRSGTALAAIAVDHAFRRDATATEVIASLRSASRSLEVWADPQCQLVQVFRPPAESALHAGGPAIAVEPMTAPADAFNSADGLRWLAPAETVSIAWGIRLGSR